MSCVSPPGPTKRKSISIDTAIISQDKTRAEAETNLLSCSEHLMVTHEIELIII